MQQKADNLLAKDGIADLNIALFVTCLVDLFRPSIGFASIELIKQCGISFVHVPESQTCCGQPAYNNGDKQNTIKLAKQLIETFENYDYVVLPSGSCTGMISIHYPELFSDKLWQKRAQQLSAKTYELSVFLNLIGITPALNKNPNLRQTISYHDSCSGLRELNIKQQPRQLLKALNNITITEAENAEECCGFGGTFCVKYADIADQIVCKKIDGIVETNSTMLLGGDLGCLMHIAGKLKTQKKTIEVRHFAEILAGQLADPAIGESQS